MREWELLVHRTDVDDFARLLNRHAVLNECLAGKDRTFQVDVQNQIVIVLGYFPDRSVLFDARVIDQDIDSAEVIDGLLHHAMNVDRQTKCRPLLLRLSGLPLEF